MFAITELFSNPVHFLLVFVALVLSITIHEFSHVLSAYLQGDMTGKSMGRLTLNPMRHIDPWGLVAMLIARIGWGRPAPFNPYNLRYHRWGSAIVAIGGPLSNIVVLMITGYVAWLIDPNFAVPTLLNKFLLIFAFISAWLAVLNLIPISPLDGSHILEAIIGPNHPLVVFLKRYGLYILLALVFLGGTYLSAYLYYGSQFLFTITGLGHVFAHALDAFIS